LRTARKLIMKIAGSRVAELEKVIAELEGFQRGLSDGRMAGA
jgi:hypothetical protein